MAMCPQHCAWDYQPGHDVGGAGAVGDHPPGLLHRGAAVVLQAVRTAIESAKAEGSVKALHLRDDAAIAVERPLKGGASSCRVCVLGQRHEHAGHAAALNALRHEFAALLAPMLLQQMEQHFALGRVAGVRRGLSEGP